MKQIDLKFIAGEAVKRRKDFARLFQVRGKAIRRLDDRFHYLHDKVFNEIDCLECANCCKILGPRITDKDIDNLSSFLNKKPQEIIELYFIVDEDGDTVFKSMPCPFLLPNNYCSIYEFRPKACREYPHTDRKKMMQLRTVTLDNASVCPAVFEILNQF